MQPRMTVGPQGAPAASTAACWLLDYLFVIVEALRPIRRHEATFDQVLNAFEEGRNSPPGFHIRFDEFEHSDLKFTGQKLGG